MSYTMTWKSQTDMGGQPCESVHSTLHDAYAAAWLSLAQLVEDYSPVTLTATTTGILVTFRSDQEDEEFEDLVTITADEIEVDEAIGHTVRILTGTGAVAGFALLDEAAVTVEVNGREYVGVMMPTDDGGDVRPVAVTTFHGDYGVTTEPAGTPTTGLATAEELMGEDDEDVSGDGRECVELRRARQ